MRSAVMCRKPSTNPWRGVEVARRQRFDAHPGRGGPLHRDTVAHALVGELGGHVQAGHRGQYPQLRHRDQGVEQGRAPFAVDPGGAPHVRREQPLAEKPGENAVGERVALPLGQRLGLAQRRLQRGRRDQKAHPQAGQQHLAVRAEVDHPAGGVQGLQRFERTIGEPKLAVVVVLDDHGPTAGGPLQQGGSSSRRHRRAGRKLVRRGYVDQPR